MIIIRLIGGLGNQMFQYAFGKALSIKMGADLKFDISHLLSRYKSRNMTFRNYDLDIFNLDIKIADNKEIKKFILPKWNVNYHLYDLCNKFYPKRNIVKEDMFNFNSDYLSIKDNHYFIGYWQSYKYFSEINDEINNDFRINDILPQSKDFCDKIMTTNSVCLSFRRKDYLKDKDLCTLVGEYFKSFYEKSINLMTSKISNPVYFIFSDDIEWCKSNIKIKEEHYFFDEKYSGYKFKNKFKLMTLCNHFIIPNSTYPWWAAWLSKCRGKIVIAPQKWFINSKINTKDLIPDYWIRI